MNKLGCLYDLPDARGSHSLDDICGSPAVPDRVDLSHLCAPVTNQNPTQSCVGHAVANAITQVMRASGHEFERPSQLLIYDMARGLVGTRGTDSGTSIGAALDAARDCGFASESAVPWEPSRVCEHIYADEYLSAICQVGLRSHRVVSDVKASIKAALAAGRGVVIAIDVDQSFESLTDGSCWDGMHGPRLGGHALSVCGYDDVNDSAYVINSWGANWGDEGFASIGWDYIESEHCRSVWIIDAAPEYWRE